MTQPQQNSVQPARRSLSTDAYHLLRSSLIEGRILPGDRLSEPQLANMLKISRSPLREALGRLELEGFVERMQNGRLHASPLNVSELEQLYILRATLEGLAARLATPRLTSENLDEMAEAVREMERDIHEGQIEKSLEAGSRFHAVIEQHCGNQPLVEALSIVRLRIVRFRSLIASVRSDDLRLSEHWTIHRAFFDRRADLAEKAMIEHVQRSAATIVSAVRTVNKSK